MYEIVTFIALIALIVCAEKYLSKRSTKNKRDKNNTVDMIDIFRGKDG